MENQTPTNERLSKVAEEQRKALFATNEYIDKNGYGSQHPNALFDGPNDDKGRGVGDSGEVGNSIDVNTRRDIIKTNRYNKNNGYGLGHPDAIFEGGDDKRGRNPAANEVGNAEDVKYRKDNKTKNRFNDEIRYPDF